MQPVAQRYTTELYESFLKTTLVLSRFV